MKAEGTSKVPEDTAKEEKAKGPRGLPEMCRQMMAGGLPPCCETQVKEMMARWMSRMQDTGGRGECSGDL